jgi:hypothetical protein
MRARRYGTALATSTLPPTLTAVASLLPDLQMFKWTPVPFVPFFERATVKQIGEMPNFVILPFSDQRNGSPGPSIKWRVEAHFQASAGGQPR